MADLQSELGVASCCGCCADTAAEYLPGGRYASENILRSADEGALVCDAANDPIQADADVMVAVAVRRA